MHYLTDRADKGFTVIQAVAVAELGGLEDPNPYGHTPFINNNPRKPSEDYFSHVDFVIRAAAERDLHIALLPTWGSHLTNWRDDRSFFSVEDAYAYGLFLGARYREQTNLIWVLGGDRPAAFFGVHDRRPHWDAMARGIIRGVAGREDDSRCLISYHPFGQHSAWLWFNDQPWFSFHMYQSGHYGRDDPNHYRAVEWNLKQTPHRPVVNAEPCYEEMCRGFNARNGLFDDTDVRESAYWSIFAGACGYAYGAHGIWQMYQPGRQPVLSEPTPWIESLALPGASQMIHLKQLLLSRETLSHRPAQRLLTHDYAEEPNHLQALRGDRHAMIYSPKGAEIHLRTRELEPGRWAAGWFNPRTGSRSVIGPVDDSEIAVYHPPGGVSRGNDWVLILDRVD